MGIGAWSKNWHRRSNASSKCLAVAVVAPVAAADAAVVAAVAAAAVAAAVGFEAASTDPWLSRLWLNSSRNVNV